jgi:DNA-directed RNA polymerase subunit RPC12/RpoP
MVRHAFYRCVECGHRMTYDDDTEELLCDICHTRVKVLEQMDLFDEPQNGPPKDAA